MLTHKDLVKKMLKRPAVKAAYDAQADEFTLLDELLWARHRPGLTQRKVAACIKQRVDAARGDANKVTE
jgi:hypothetical protein